MRVGFEVEERAGFGDDKSVVAFLLSSFYSKVISSRKFYRCSSGYGSDNSSVLSGEFSSVMGKTAFFYYSGGSSGYESMMRDSEVIGSAFFV